MDTAKEIEMSASQLFLLINFLPDGVVLEIKWEDVDGTGE